MRWNISTISFVQNAFPQSAQRVNGIETNWVGKFLIDPCFRFTTSVLSLQSSPLVLPMVVVANILISLPAAGTMLFQYFSPTFVVPL